MENAHHIDPAVIAVAAFRDVECRLVAWIDAHDGYLADRARLAMLSRTGKHLALMPEASDLDEVALQERDWHVDYDTALKTVAGTVPTTIRGAAALADVFAHQERMGAPTALLDRAWRSHARGLAQMPVSEWGAL